ncbi:MAG: hypothetical protein ACLGSD_08490 [Acidobacteriota bacterium]
MKNRRSIFDMKVAYAAAILFFPICICYALIDRSQQRSAFLFFVVFGAIWGAIWASCTWIQLRRLRLAGLWIIPVTLVEMAVSWPIVMPSRIIAWLLGASFLIAQIVFAYLPPRTYRLALPSDSKPESA